MTDDKSSRHPMTWAVLLRWRLRFVICHLSFVILFAGCATRPTFRTVVLAPGHGGHDPGATQPAGQPPNIWTLDLALRRKSRLHPGGFRLGPRLENTRFIPLPTPV